MVSSSKREIVGHVTTWSDHVTRWPTTWPTNNYKLYIYFNDFGLHMARWPRIPCPTLGLLFNAEQECVLLVPGCGSAHKSLAVCIGEFITR